MQSPQIVQRTPATIMREESCEERCERNFNESSGDGMSRIAQRGYCLQGCRPPEREPEPERKPDPPPQEKAPAAACKPGDQPVACDAPSGTPVQPAKVSNTMVGRWMGKFAAVDGDPGEGCIEHPYVAAAGEKVCTIGYGIQLPNCPVVSKATGGEPTKEERFPTPPKTPEEKKNFKPGIQNLRCNCPDQKPVDCKGAEAENLLRSRSVNGETEVHTKVPVSLDQAQFDALVDLAMHHGSMPADLLTAITTYWCTDAGKDHVRQLYLKSMLNPQGSKKPSQGFIDRRRRRVWPQACPPALQRKPRLGTPGDRFEREADAVADQVMRMASATPVSAAMAGITSLQRTCADCEDEAVDATIRREAGAADAADTPPLDTEAAARAAQQGGAPLSPDQRDFFEPRLGHDLGHVRVHTGGSAEAGASAVQARAYTLGRDIVFGSGEYRPDTPAGQRLLAHELVHVLQQGEAPPAVQRTLKVDAAASDDPATAISTIKPLVTALCPDFEIAATGQVLPTKGSACAGFKFGQVAKGKQKVGCCCLCTLTAAPDAWRIVVTTKDAPTTDEAGRQVSMTPTAGPAAPSLSYWTAAQKVQTLPFTEAFGHELCGHAALMQIKAHPSSSAADSDRAYSDVHDPTVRIENALATEMGLGGDRRGLAGSGVHRGESLRVFSVGPYAADADDPAPFAAQIKAAVDFLNGNERLLVDEIGLRDAADKTATVSQTRADKVEAELRKGIAKADVEVETTPGTDETLTRVQPATDGGVGATPGVELRMAIRPAGLAKPAGAAPPKAPVHVDPGNPAVVAALKGKGAFNPCHVLLSGTAWP